MKFGENDKAKTKTEFENDFNFEVNETNSENSPAIINEDKNLEAEPKSFVFETNEEETLVKRKKRRKKQNQPYILLLSLVIATIYIIGALVYMNNLSGSQLNLDSFTILITLLGPAFFAVLAGLLGEGLARSNRESRAITSIAKRLFEPEKLLEDGTKTRIKMVRDEIERLEQSLNSATNRLGGLENAIAQKANSLRAATEEARGGADNLVSTMESERARLAAILDGLSELNKSAQLTAKSATIGLDEKAEILSRAAKSLTENANIATQSADMAAQKLDSAINKALGAVSTLDDASVRGEQALARAHDLMVLARVRADDAIGGVSNAVEYLQDAALNASETAKQVSELVSVENQKTRQIGISAISDLQTIAEQSAQQIVIALRAEADNARLKAQESLQAFEETAYSIRKLTEEAGLLIEDQLSKNKQRVEGIRQQTFEMGQEADNFAQKRLDSARDLISQSTGLLDDAGNKIDERFKQVANACVDQARAVEDIIEGLNTKLNALPNEAKERAIAVEAALSETLDNLNKAGKNAAKEAEELNSAFQERLHNSYSALGDMARKLASISGVVTPNIAPLDNYSNNDAPNNILPDPLQFGKKDKAELLNNKIEEPIIKSGFETIAEKANNEAIKIEKPVEKPIEKPVEKPIEVKIPKPDISKTVFSSVLSPQTPVRSTPIIENKPEPKIIPKIVPPIGNRQINSEPPQFILRGRLDNQPKIIPNPKPEPLPIEEKPVEAPKNLAETEIAKKAEENQIDDHPFGDFRFSQNPINNNTNKNWTWREVLTSIDDKSTSNSNNFIENIIIDFGLKTILSDVVLDRFMQIYMRSPQKARGQTQMALPKQIALLNRRMAENLELRSQLVRFVENKLDDIRQGKLNGDDLRIYLFADAALDA